HTGTHVLHWALRSVVGQHVQQAGSLVEAGRLRFDFSHQAALEDDVVAEVERVANERVIENARVRVYQVARQEAEELGALAFFGDKYGEVVRVVEAGSYSRELCGGTHVPSTGQIGPLVVVGESSIGSNLRRIEAYTGSSGYAYLSGLRRQLETAASHLRTRPDQVGEAAAALVARTKAQEDRLEAFEAGSRSVEAARLVESAEVHGGNRLVVAGREGLQPDELRQLAMQIRDRLGSGVVVVGSARAGKAGVVVAVTPELARSGVSAAEIAGAAAAVLGGGASRDPELSQAGGPHGDRIGDALEEAGRIATEALGG
ncbi:MAG TPA: DHHA1 domain-containing protein, partial [Acidimicrobiia bacterium]